MNEQNANPVPRIEPSDEQILAGLRARMTGVEPLIPPPPAWLSGRVGQAVRPHVRVRTLARGMSGLALVAAAVVIVALAAGPLGVRNGPAANPLAGPTATASAPAGVKLMYAMDPVGGRLPTKAEGTQLTDLIAARLQALGIGNFTIGAGTSIQIEIPARSTSRASATC